MTSRSSTRPPDARPTPSALPEDFARALRSLRDAPRPSRVKLKEIPAPGRLAPFAAALTGELFDPARPEIELADGRFILLYDPQWRPDWNGTFRIVSLVRTELEAEIGADPLLSQVAWTWLTDCLADNVEGFDALTGTVTRVLNQNFGTAPQGVDGQGGLEDHVELEIRASWTPSSPEVGPHLGAWTDFLAATAGSPPLPEGVVPLK